MFNDIQKEIDAMLSKHGAVQTPAAQSNTTGVAPFVMSEPGSEKVHLHTSTIDFMTCLAVGDTKKKRYCIIHKNMPVTRKGQWVNIDGHPVSIVTRDVFNDTLQIAASAGNQIEDLKREIAMLTNERDAYKLTIDALRKNGVID